MRLFHQIRQERLRFRSRGNSVRPRLFPLHVESLSYNRGLDYFDIVSEKYDENLGPMIEEGDDFSALPNFDSHLRLSGLVGWISRHLRSDGFPAI